MSQPLITANQLEELLNTGADVLLCDCRFDLAKPTAGREAYQMSHLPGAIYVDLDEDLSGPQTGANGRHPLPSPEVWAKTRQRLGINLNTQVVAYDNQGSVFASRLWWMLRAIGHDQVQVLDGGLDAWNGAIGSKPREPIALDAIPTAVPYRDLVLVEEVVANLGMTESAARLVLDARTPDRFRGENETLDPVGGHIPGATNRCFKENLRSKQFKTADELYREFSILLAGRSANKIIHQCGSGVTACHNLLAMEVAGIKGSQLYAGSWSEWCADSQRPIATAE